MTEVRAMEWRNCPRFPNFDVSEWGDVRRAVSVHGGNAGQRIKGTIDGDGYLRYALTRDGVKAGSTAAYRLVAEAFIGPRPDENHEVAHNNGSRVCCHFTEIRWATRASNHADTKVHNTTPGVGARNPNAKLTDADVIEIRRIYRACKNGDLRASMSALAQKYGLHHTSLSRVATGKQWRHLAMPSDE